MKNCNNYDGTAELLTKRRVGVVSYLFHQEVLMESKKRWNLKDHKKKKKQQ